MLYHYLIIAWRNLQKGRIFSLMNILGLAVSLTAVLIIFLYIISESSADNQHTKADQIYRIGYHVLQPGVLQTALSSGPVGPAMTADYPEILDYVRMMNPAEFKGDFLLSHGDKSAYESGLVFTDTNFFDFFDYEFVHGNKTTALANPNDIVITYEKAIFFFGQSNPLGKVIRIDGEHPMVVSAVVRQPDSPTHLRFHYLIPLQAMNGYLASAFGPFTSLRSINYQTYLLVDKNFDPEDFKKRNAEEYVPRYIIPAREAENPLDVHNFEFTPLRSIYFDNDTFGGLSNPDQVPHRGNKAYLLVFGILAGFLSVIAVVNYTNMAIARSLKRSKEVGVRKVLGSGKSRLIIQHMGEAALFIILATLLALIIAETSLPAFNALMNKNISLNYLLAYPGTLLFLGFIMLLTLLTGGYPAFYISGTEAIHAIKGEFKMKGKVMNLKNLLFSFQFFFSVFIIICTILVHQQFNYMQQKDLGYATEHRVIVSLPQAERITPQWISGFREELLQHTHVAGVSTALRNPLPGNMIETWMFPIEKSYGTEETVLRIAFVDPDFIDLYNISVIEGRNFSWDHPSDIQGGVLLNESAVRDFGWENPVGMTIRRYDHTYQVLGVVSDFHFFSLHQPIEPMMLVGRAQGKEVSVKLDPQNTESGLQHIERLWRELLPEYPVDYTFLEDQVAVTLEEEKKTAALLSVLAAFAIFISLTGLFGLSAFTAEQRTREIAIRRTYGASQLHIILMLSKQFGWLLGMSLLLAVPVAYYYAGRWLENYSYRIDLTPWPFLAGILSAIAITFLTLWYHSVKSTGANPVDVLRHE